MSVRRISALISLTLFISFIFFSYLVSKEVFTSFDFNTTVKLQDHLSRRFDFPFSLLSLLGSAEITGIIWIILAAFAALKRYWLTLVSFFLFFPAAAMEIFGKLFIFHPGPPFAFFRGVINLNFPSHYVHTNYSYPSGHMIRTSFLITFLIFFLYFRFPKKGIFVQIILAGLLLLMVISRVYLGEHWTSDVIGGMLLGSSLGLFTASTIPIKNNVIEGGQK